MWPGIPYKKWSSHHSQQKSPKCSTWVQSQKWLISVCFQGKPFNIRVNTNMVVQTHRTLFADTFSHEMVQCVLVVSLHSSETERKHALWTWDLGPDGKRHIFPQWKLDSCSLKFARKTHWFIFFPLIQQLWSPFGVFWKKQDAYHFMLGSHLSVCFT